MSASNDNSFGLIHWSYNISVSQSKSGCMKLFPVHWLDNREKQEITIVEKLKTVFLQYKCGIVCNFSLNLLLFNLAKRHSLWSHEG